jgi:hypothetical protein
MPYYTAVLKLEFRAKDHDAANDRAWRAKHAIGGHDSGVRVALLGDQCEEVEVSAADTMDDGAAT